MLCNIEIRSREGTILSLLETVFVIKINHFPFWAYFCMFVDHNDLKKELEMKIILSNVTTIMQFIALRKHHGYVAVQMRRFFFLMFTYQGWWILLVDELMSWLHGPQSVLQEIWAKSKRSLGNATFSGSKCFTHYWKVRKMQIIELNAIIVAVSLFNISHIFVCNLLFFHFHSAQEWKWRHGCSCMRRHVGFQWELATASPNISLSCAAITSSC